MNEKPKISGTALIGPVFANEGQFSKICGKSRSWLQKRRWKGDGPVFLQEVEGGPVLYEVEKALDWFRAKYPERTSTSAHAMSEALEDKMSA